MALREKEKLLEKHIPDASRAIHGVLKSIADMCVALISFLFSLHDGENVWRAANTMAVEFFIFGLLSALSQVGAGGGSEAAEALE